jgi:DNA-binding response OmpR family regulator
MNKKALIVDDEADIRFLLGLNLEKQGFVCVDAGNISDGLKMAEKEIPAVIFLDINLPDGNGLENISEFKAMAGSNVFIIMISANDGNEERAAAKKNGAAFFIGKPLCGEKITAALETCGLI